MKMTGTVIRRIENGKLAEKWSNKDVFGFASRSALFLRPEHTATL
jgi:hypothetical protein